MQVESKYVPLKRNRLPEESPAISGIFNKVAANHDRNHSILQEEHWLIMREHKTAHRKQKAPHWIVITIRGRLLAYIAGYPVGAESEASPARRTSIS
jgi:hypothetical protein